MVLELLLWSVVQLSFEKPSLGKDLVSSGGTWKDALGFAAVHST
jgi:hypothetical protein